MGRKESALKYFEQNREYMDFRVKTGIELYRKGNETLTVVDKDGNPVKGAKIIAKQKKHEFKYGANIFMLDEFESEEKNRAYRELFKDTFNLATVPFYWSDLEPEQGKPRYTADSPKIYRRPATDLCVDYCLKNGVEPKCHCLNYDSFAPSWIKSATVTEHKALLEKRFRELSERYSKVIPMWEVTNETLQDEAHHRTKFYYEDDFLSWSYRLAEKYFPLNHLIINDYYIWDGLFMNDRSAYYMQIERLLNRDKIPHLDSIGMQFHSFFAKEREEDVAKNRYNPVHLYSVLDRYAKLGKKIQITEMTLPAYSPETEDEEVQAELLKNVYSVFFSHPAMEAIIYWNVVDGYAAFAPQGDMTKGENVYHGGLLSFDFRKKKAFDMLNHLFKQEWHTEVETATDDGGKASFRGFYGDYDISVIADGKETKATETLYAGEYNEKKIVID